MELPQYTERELWKEICQNVNSGGEITRDFFLSFSVYSTVLRGTDDSFYNDMESRETGRESHVLSHLRVGSGRVGWEGEGAPHTLTPCSV